MSVYRVRYHSSCKDLEGANAGTGRMASVSSFFGCIRRSPFFLKKVRTICPCNRWMLHFVYYLYKYTVDTEFYEKHSITMLPLRVPFGRTDRRTRFGAARTGTSLAWLGFSNRSRDITQKFRRPGRNSDIKPFKKQHRMLFDP